MYAAQARLLGTVLEEGLARAIAGPGTPQDDTKATAAPVFTEAEKVLDLTVPAAVLRRRFAVLNMFGPRARVRVDDTEFLVTDLYTVSATIAPGELTEPAVPETATTVPEGALTVPPRPERGTVIAQNPDGVTVQTADQPVRLVTTPIPS